MLRLFKLTRHTTDLLTRHTTGLLIRQHGTVLYQARCRLSPTNKLTNFRQRLFSSEVFTNISAGKNSINCAINEFSVKNENSPLKTDGSVSEPTKDSGGETSTLNTSDHGTSGRTFVGPKEQMTEADQNESDKIKGSSSTLNIDSTYKEYFTKTYGDYDKSIRNFGNDLNHILEEFEKKKYNTSRLKYIGATVGVIILFMFWRTIKSFLSKETSDVAIRTMNDEEFQKQMYSTLLKTLNDARNDEQVAIMLADLMNKAMIIAMSDERTSKLLHDEEFVKVLISVASEVVNSEQIKKDLDELSSKEIQTQLIDEQNKKLLADTFYDAAVRALLKFKPWGKKE